MSLALQKVKEVNAEEIRDGNYNTKHISVLHSFSPKYNNNRLSHICNFTG